MNTPQLPDSVSYSPGSFLFSNDISYKKRPAVTVPTVLLVDDDPDQLEIISLILRREKYRLKMALSAEEALNVLDNEKVNCIVCDVMMPWIGGEEFVKLVRQREAFVPILMISAGGDELEMKLLQSGADMYCSKKKLLKTLVPQIKLLLS